MADTGERGLSPLQAFEAVMGFARRRGEPALQLALHAAVPQVVHVELLHLLCVNFVGAAHHRGVVETDVMFSPFCSDLGNGYFRFDGNARQQLLQQLDPSHTSRAEPRSLQVADFLLTWFDRQLASERGDIDPLYRSWIEVERWNALAFRDPEATAEQLAAAVQQACAPDQTSARLRVGTLAASLAPQLMRHQQLLRYAAGVEAVQSGAIDAPVLLHALGDEALQVGSVSLPPAKSLLAAPAAPMASPPLADADVGKTPSERAPPAPGASAPLQNLPHIADCEFTAFISYAHADDEAWFGWVTQFRNELERGLAAMLRGVRLPRLHLSGEVGPSAGSLSAELNRRLEASYALIVVVHENYAQSDWCLKEIEQFRACYGDAGLRERLYIVAMSEPAMQKLSHRPEWHRLFAEPGPQWQPFFDPADTGRPLDIYMGQGLVSMQFRKPFESLRSNLAAKLRRSASYGQGHRAPAPGAPTPKPSIDPSQVLFGFVPPGLSTSTAVARDALQQYGVSARQLASEVVFNDFEEFASAGHLVLAFDDQPLMMSSMAAGGHLELQRDAWQRKSRPPELLHWLDLRSQPPAKPAQGAAAWVESLGVTPVRIEVLVQRLAPGIEAQPQAAVPGVKIYIESNRHERTLWEPLGELLRQRWARLRADQQPPRTLRCRGLPVDQIDSFPNLDDADGVVLLWGRKTSEALVAQINKVENKMSPGRAAAPGIVAYLMPPQPASEAVPAWGWQVLRFEIKDNDNNKNEDRQEEVVCVPDDMDELDRFLLNVLERRRRRDDESLA